MRKTRQQLLREARDAALELARKGNHAAALERFGELERMEPTEADWPRRAAECHRALADLPQQVTALGRAAELYAQAGAMAKAIAMCRMILAVDPRHTRTQERLAELQAREGTVHQPPRARVATATQAPGRALPAPDPTLVAKPPAPRTEPERPRPELGRLLRQRYVEKNKPPNPVPGARPAPPRPQKPPAPEAPLPFLPEGSLNEMVPGSKRMRDPRGIPSGMFRIDVGQAPPPPADLSKQAAQKALPTTPLFSELGPRSLERLIAGARLEHFDAGAPVYRLNDAAETLHVIVSGTVVILAGEEPRIEVTRLTEGDFFGEAALMSNEPRLTAAEASEPTDVLTIDRAIIRELVAEEPGVLTVVLRFLRERLIESSMLTNPLFTVLSGGERRRLAAHFEFVEIEAGSLAVWQGVRAPGLFILLSGSAEVVRDDAIEEYQLATLGPGAVFGEMSLLDGGAAIADVRCAQRSYALMLPKAEFARVSADYPSMVEFIRLLAESRRRENEVLLGVELLEEAAPE